MSQITSLYVYKVIAQASPGVETRDLLEGLQLNPDGPIDPSQMVAAAEYYDFFSALADRDPQGLVLPLQIGAAMCCDDYSAFGLAWKSAPNLRGSFVRSERYGHVLGSAETYTLEPYKESFFFNLEKAGEEHPGMLLSNEASMSAVATICEEVSTETFVPQAVYLKHAPRGDIAVYESHFGCPVYFESGRNALLVSEQSLNTPNKLGDETIATFFDHHLEQTLATLTLEPGLDQQVRSVITNLLSEGVPTISFVASELRIGARTLQRRLSDQGYSFQRLIDMARKDLAQRLLRETNYSLAEVAFLTGFSEQSGFTRAFKRWVGQTPRSYRLNVNV